MNNKQIQRPALTVDIGKACSCCNWHQYEEDVTNEEIDTEGKELFSRSAPEISVFSADAVELELDSYTGLPVLPVELPPPSPVLERPLPDLLLLQGDQKNIRPPAIKMSSSPLGQSRKSVTFEPTRVSQYNRA